MTILTIIVPVSTIHTQCWGSRCEWPPLNFYMGAEIQIQTLLFVQQALFPMELPLKPPAGLVLCSLLDERLPEFWLWAIWNCVCSYKLNELFIKAWDFPSFADWSLLFSRVVRSFSCIFTIRQTQSRQNPRWIWRRQSSELWLESLGVSGVDGAQQKEEDTFSYTTKTFLTLSLSSHEKSRWISTERIFSFLQKRERGPREVK